MTWPFTIPDDLRIALETQAGMRSPPSDQDRWIVIKEWLEMHRIEAPENLPMRPEISEPGKEISQG